MRAPVCNHSPQHDLPITDSRDEIRVAIPDAAATPPVGRERLARRASVDRVEPVQRPRHRIAPLELKRVSGLRLDVHSDDIEPGAVIAHGRTARTAEQIKQAGSQWHDDIMTTPVAPSLTISTDKPSYAPGDTVTLTAAYSDETGTTFTVNVTADAADSASPPNTATATTSFAVSSAASELMTITVTDDHSDTYAQVSNVPGTAVFTTTAPSS